MFHRLRHWLIAALTSPAEKVYFRALVGEVWWLTDRNRRLEAVCAEQVLQMEDMIHLYEAKYGLLVRQFIDYTQGINRLNRDVAKRNDLS